MFLKKIKEESEEVIIIIYFICQIVLDFIQKINKNFNLEIPRFHRYIKIIFLIYICTKIFKNLKFLYKKNLFVYVLLLLFSFVVSKNYTESRIEYMIQYSYFLLVALFYLKYNLNSLKLHRVIKILITINFIFIIIGLTFGTSIFYTYGHSRFGYNGFIITQMQTTVFYLSCLAFCLHFNYNAFFFITFISGILCGPKALIFGIPILVLLHNFFEVKNKKSGYTIIFVLAISIFVLIFVYHTSLFKSILDEDGFLSLFFSYRDQLFMNTFKTIRESYSLLNLFVGGYDLSIYKVELDFVDIILFFGTIGLIIFILIFNSLYKNYCVSSASKSYFITILIAAFFGGNIIVYPFNSFLFLTTLKLIYDSKQNKHT